MAKKGNNRRPYQTKFSFGSTSMIVTSLGLIAGLGGAPHGRLAILGGILIIALADNISDSFGIHIYSESECLTRREVWFQTLTNFASRLVVGAIFFLLVALLPIVAAIYSSIIFGLGFLAVMSYSIARNEKDNPAFVVLEHLGIAVVVIILSNLVGRWLTVRFY